MGLLTSAVRDESTARRKAVAFADVSRAGERGFDGRNGRSGLESA
jgi:hypothetical protein